MKSNRDTGQEILAITRSFLILANDGDPREFQKHFIAILATVICMLDDDYFAAICEVEPCGTLDCKCHMPAKIIMDAFAECRRKYPNFQADEEGIAIFKEKLKHALDASAN